MIKYKAIIPPASAQRMEADRVFEIQYSDGWIAGRPKEHRLEPGQTEFEFELPIPFDKYAGCIDAPHYIFEVVYRNSTKSREERKRIIPEILP